MQDYSDTKDWEHSSRDQYIMYLDKCRHYLHQCIFQLCSLTPKLMVLYQQCAIVCQTSSYIVHIHSRRNMPIGTCHTIIQQHCVYVRRHILEYSPTSCYSVLSPWMSWLKLWLYLCLKILTETARVRTSRGRFKKTYELLNLRALKFSPVTKIPPLSMYGKDILCGISKVPFEIPHTISYPYIERYDIL